jgi:hypothetical protein
MRGGLFLISFRKRLGEPENPCHMPGFSSGFRRASGSEKARLQRLVPASPRFSAPDFLQQARAPARGIRIVRPAGLYS